MRGLSFVVAAVIAAKSSAEQQMEENGYYLPQSHYVDQAQQQVIYSQQPRYVTAAPELMAPYVYQEQPQYMQQQPIYASPYGGAQYIEVPADPYRIQPQPQIRYVQAPAEPVYHQQPKEEKVGEYVQVPKEMYERLLAQQTHEVVKPVEHHTTTATTHHESKPVVHKEVPLHHEAVAPVTHHAVPVTHHAAPVTHHAEPVMHHTVVPTHHESPHQTHHAAPVTHHEQTHQVITKPQHHEVMHPQVAHHEPVHAVAAHHDTPVTVHHTTAHPDHKQPAMTFRPAVEHQAVPHHVEAPVVHHKVPESHHIEHPHAVHKEVHAHAPVTHVASPHHSAAHAEAAATVHHEQPLHVTGKEHHGAKTHHETVASHHTAVPVDHHTVKVAPKIHHEAVAQHHVAAPHLEVLSADQKKPVAAEHPKAVSHHEAPVVHHSAPVHHAAPVPHAAPVHHAEPVHHTEPVHQVHHSMPVHPEAPHETAKSHKGEPGHWEGPKSHTRGHEGSGHGQQRYVHEEGDYPATYKDHAGHPYEQHSRHDMDPAHHHMTSQYSHGHEYDTYHYEDKKHQTQHFTVTRPEQHDVVQKGDYYHAHPQDVSGSYPHHHAHHYYEVQKVPYHADDHHYARDVHFDPIHPHQLLPDMATHYYAEDMRPHLSEERHTYSGEAKETFWPSHDHRDEQDTNGNWQQYKTSQFDTMTDADFHRLESDAHLIYDDSYHQAEAMLHEPDWSEKYHHATRQMSNDFHHDDEDYYHQFEDYHHDKHKHTCWKKATSRQSGFYPTCGKSGEQSGTYCYKKCEKGFTGVGPVCYQDCNNFGAVIPPPVPKPPTGLFLNSLPSMPAVDSPTESSDSAKSSKDSGSPKPTTPATPTTPTTPATPTTPSTSGSSEDAETGELVSLKGLGGLVSGGGDPRKGMHEDTEFCYKQETIPRPGGGFPEFNMKTMHVYEWNKKWYMPCPPNYHSVGCCICSPNCPQGMTDLGFKCKKDSYMRHGTEWKCPAGQEQSGDLCYPKCKAGQVGHGPVCYDACPAGTNECGPLCLREGELCNDELQAAVNHVYPMIVDYAEHTKEGTQVDIENFSTDMIHPSC